MLLSKRIKPMRPCSFRAVIKLFSSILGVIILGGVTSCGLVPDPPDLRAAPQCALEQAKLEAIAEAAYITDHWMEHEWWHYFGDPQLDRLIEQALLEHPSIEEAQARLGAAIAISEKAEAPLWPGFNFETDITKVHQSPNGIFGILQASDPAYPITYRQRNMEIGFQYDFDFFKIHSNEIIAQLDEVQALKAEEYIARMALAISVAQTYYQNQICRAREKLAEHLLNNRQDMISLSEKRQTQGLVGRVNINNAVNDALRTKQNLSQLSQETLTSGYELQALLAGDFAIPVCAIDIDGHLEPFPVPCSLSLDLLAHRPDVWAHRWRVEAAARQICIARAAFYPNIKFQGLIGLQAVNDLPFFTWDSIAGFLYGPTLRLPIFDGGAIKGDYDNRRQQYRLAVAQYDACVLTATREVLNALVALRKTDERYHIARQLEKLAWENAENSRLRLKYTLNSKLDFMSSENDWLQAKDASLQAYMDCLQARLVLIRSLGGGYEFECDKFDL